MTYPTPPGHRMAYDVDGTKMFVLRKSTGVIAETSTTSMEQLNDNTDSAYAISNTYTPDPSLVFVFPELRDIKGLFWARRSTARNNMELTTISYSRDTTNLIDGTWTNLFEDLDPSDSTLGVVPNYLTDIREVEALGIRALCFDYTGGVSNQTLTRSWPEINIYGQISANQELDRLELWHPTEDTPIPVGYFDWGDVPRGTQGSRQFRVKNSSADRTATDITVSLSTLNDDNPSILAQHSFERDGVIVPNELDLGDLGVGHISDIITIRYTITEDAVLGPKSLRVHATPTGWT